MRGHPFVAFFFSPATRKDHIVFPEDERLWYVANVIELVVFEAFEEVVTKNYVIIVVGYYYCRAQQIPPNDSPSNA